MNPGITIMFEASITSASPTCSCGPTAVIFDALDQHVALAVVADVGIERQHAAALQENSLDRHAGTPPAAVMAGG